MSEDCLHLNVWTPALRDGGKRPVLVWFHPGGYSGGTSNEVEADGARLSRGGNVTVVTVNHRLNVFGHLFLAEIGGEAFADSGNVGILDLILALQWVRDNIEEFGGDPRNVTIFGQSGGGAKCATLMAMPAAAGLFHRVLTMSGQQITASRVTTATHHAEQLLAALSLSRDRVHLLQSLPMEQLVAASRAPAYMGPVKDGRSLPRDPFDPDAPPLSAAIPMILGNTAGETRTLIGRGDPSIFDLTWETLVPKLEAHSPFMGDLDRREVIASYRRWYPDYSPADVFFASTTASRSWRGQVVEADRRAAQAAAAAHTWVFQFDWPTPIDGGRWGAHHGLDVPFIFDNVAARAGEGRHRRGRGAAGRADERDVRRLRAHRPSRFAGPARLARLRPHAARDDGVRPDHPGGRRSARPGTSLVRPGAVCPAWHVAPPPSWRLRCWPAPRPRPRRSDSRPSRRRSTGSSR